MTRYRIGILSSLVSLALLAGCSNSGSCKSACRKIAKCMGIKLDSGVTPAGDGGDRVTGGQDTTKGDDTSAGSSWTCPLSTECTEKESCYARCINKADCDAITGKDQEAAAALAKCQLACDQQQFDATTPDGGPRPDGDVTKQDACVPSCSEKQCGDDGCGGSCGTCEGGLVCNTTLGQCVESCTPDCSGKQCGDDGCGGSCGSCGSGYYCDNYYQCQPSCTPNCSGKQCGDDGCGGTCGTCGTGSFCNAAFQCESNCTPSCTNKVCGDDGCGGSCGTCSTGYNCVANQCFPPGSCALQEYPFDTGTMEGVVETHTDSTVRWQVVNTRYHSASYSLYYGDPSAGNFAGSGSNSGTAFLPTISVPSNDNSKLTFWLYMDVETGTSYDVLKVKFGSTTLWTKPSTFTMKQWTQIDVDLASIKGQTGELGFEFATNDGSGNSTEGVYVDTITVQLGCP